MGQTKVIAFSGAQGTGKSTMNVELESLLKEKDYDVVRNFVGVKESIHRDAANKGFKINLKADFMSEYYTLSSYIRAELETRNFVNNMAIDFLLLDRSIIDSIAYLNMCPAITPWQRKYLRTMILQHFELFSPDVIIFCRPLDVLKKDEHRSDDRAYQRKIDFAIKEELEFCKTWYYSNVFNLRSDSIKNRTKLLVDGLRNFGYDFL